MSGDQYRAAVERVTKYANEDEAYAKQAATPQFAYDLRARAADLRSLLALLEEQAGQLAQAALALDEAFNIVSGLGYPEAASLFSNAAKKARSALNGDQR